MKTLAAVLCALTLAGCASTAPVAPIVHQDAGRALITAEMLVDAAVLSADVAVRSRLTTPEQNARIVALASRVQDYLVIARRAYAASDQTDMLSMAAALTALAAQLDASHQE